jgi:hypothetical protein
MKRSTWLIRIKIPTSLESSNNILSSSFATTFDHFFGVVVLLVVPCSVQ